MTGQLRDERVYLGLYYQSHSQKSRQQRAGMADGRGRIECTSSIGSRKLRGRTIKIVLSNLLR